MSEIRIKIPKDKTEIIEKLKAENNGPFKTKAQVIAFAAAYGAFQAKPLPFADGFSEPIRYEIFSREGLEPVINLVAVGYTKDINVLANSEEMESKRVQIFEEFANRGLELLAGELRGEVDFTGALYLVLMKYKPGAEVHDALEDLTGLF